VDGGSVSGLVGDAQAPPTLGSNADHMVVGSANPPQHVPIQPSHPLARTPPRDSSRTKVLHCATPPLAHQRLETLEAEAAALKAQLAQRDRQQQRPGTPSSVRLRCGSSSTVLVPQSVCRPYSRPPLPHSYQPQALSSHLAVAPFFLSYLFFVSQCSRTWMTTVG